MSAPGSKSRVVLLLGLLLAGFYSGLLPAGLSWAQQVPDAPSASRPPQPGSFPPPTQTPPPANSPAPPPAEAEPQPAPDVTARPPQPKIRQVPAGGATAMPGSRRDEMFTLTRNVNFVLVPVTVKDSSSHLVDGLGRRDFSVYEDGVEQPVTYFTSDPFPLSAAVVVDTGLPEITLRKVKQTFSTLEGSFSQFDEISIFSFGGTVEKLLDFAPINERVSKAMQRLKSRTGTGGVPVIGGPLGSGPTVNGRPADPGAPHVQTPPKEGHVLNDAVLAAALELAKTSRDRRRILFIISDGRESSSNASYSDVLKVLLSHEISVYAVVVGADALPGYGTLDKFRIPVIGTGNILPKYASATAGGVFSEFSRQAMESAYARLTEEARNQYTLGYTTRATAASNYRTIEVKVHRGGLKVYAREGYYPLPPGRSGPSSKLP